MISGSLPKRYARALAGHVRARGGDIEPVAAELGAAAGLLEPGNPLQRLMANRLVPAADKGQALEKVIAALKPSPLMADFLRLLFRKGRLLLLPDVNREFRRVADDLQGILRGELIVADELPGKVVESLTQKLSANFSKKVILTTHRDPSIIGGLIVKVGSLSLDGSLRAQMHSIREKLIEEVTQ